MPECLDCGNTSRFEHHVMGTQTRIYDEDGDYQETEAESLSTDRMECAECGSGDIHIE